MNPSTLPDGTTRSYIDADMAVALRHRLMNVPTGASKEGPKLSYGSGEVQTNGSNKDEKGATASAPKMVEPEYAILAHHPEEEISNLANDLVEMDSELCSQGPNPVRWPANISLANFADYQLIPTLVYELSYPRTER